MSRRTRYSDPLVLQPRPAARAEPNWRAVVYYVLDALPDALAGPADIEQRDGTANVFPHLGDLSSATELYMGLPSLSDFLKCSCRDRALQSQLPDAIYSTGPPVSG